MAWLLSLLETQLSKFWRIENQVLSRVLWLASDCQLTFKQYCIWNFLSSLTVLPLLSYSFLSFSNWSICCHFAISRRSGKKQRFQGVKFTVILGVKRCCLEHFVRMFSPHGVCVLCILLQHVFHSLFCMAIAAFLVCRFMLSRLSYAVSWFCILKINRLKQDNCFLACLLG